MVRLVQGCIDTNASGNPSSSISLLGSRMVVLPTNLDLMAGGSPGSGNYNSDFPPLRPMKFNICCGLDDLRLDSVPVTFEDGAVVIDVVEEEEVPNVGNVVFLPTPLA